MNNKRSRKHIIYALVSFACPIVAFFAMDLYQSTINADFWQSLVPGDDSSNTAGAMMAIGELIQMIYSLLLACFIGLIFAILSLRHRRRILSLGTAALIFNGVPLLMLVALVIRGLVNGF